MTLHLPRRCRRTVAMAIAASALSAAAVRGADAFASAGLVAAYGFEENAGPQTGDASGNGNTALLVGATWTTEGKFGSALVFDGTTARVTLVNDSPLLRLTTAMTLEAWVKPQTVTGSWRDVIYKGNDNYFLEATTDHGGAPAAGGIFGGTNAAAYDTTALALAVWSHLAVTYDGAQLRLYVNGVQVSSLTRTGSLRTSGYPLQIGGDSFFGQSFAGTIDEVRVYNRALGPAEIQSDKNTPVVTPVVDTDPPTTPGAPTAAAISGTEIRLNWPASTDNVGVAGYRVERCRGASCSAFVQLTTPPGPRFDDTGLALNTSYSYRARARDDANNPSPYSTIASATTLAGTTVPGLVAAYAFDEGAGVTTSDASGGGNTGALTSTTWTSAGRFGRALTFNGATSWVTVNDAPSLHLAGGMTLEAWVNPLSIPLPSCTGASCSWVDVVFKESDRYYLEASSDINGQPEAGGIFGSGKHILFAPAPLAINTWTHLAVTYDSAMIRLYVNGTVVASSPETSPLTVSAAPLRIGGNGVYGQHFNGTIDEVRVYNRALSADEILGDTIASVGSAGAHPMPTMSALAPDKVIAGGAGFALSVTGTGFVPESVVGWNGADRPTTFVSAAELRADIAASDIVAGGTADVTVYNLPPLGGTTAARSVAICVAAQETCNGIDDDCDGLIDDADPSVAGRPAWYRDADGDAHGYSAQSQLACAQPAGYVPTWGDCDDANGAAWSVPGEVGDLLFVDASTLVFAAPLSPGGTTIAYDTLRADAPTGFDGAATSIEVDGSDTSTIDAALPAEGAVYCYLIRATNACGPGPLQSFGDFFEKLQPRLHAQKRAPRHRGLPRRCGRWASVQDGTVGAIDADMDTSRRSR